MVITRYPGSFKLPVITHSRGPSTRLWCMHLSAALSTLDNQIHSQASIIMGKYSENLYLLLIQNIGHQKNISPWRGIEPRSPAICGTCMDKFRHDRQGYLPLYYHGFDDCIVKGYQNITILSLLCLIFISGLIAELNFIVGCRVLSW